MQSVPPSEWINPERVHSYLDRADGFPHRAEGESVLLEHIPQDAQRVLDLGTGDGRLLALFGRDRPEIVAVGLDFSEVMLDAGRKRFADDERIELSSTTFHSRYLSSGASTLSSRRSPSTTSSTSESGRSMERSSTCSDPAACSRTLSTWRRRPTVYT